MNTYNKLLHTFQEQVIYLSSGLQRTSCMCSVFSSLHLDLWDPDLERETEAEEDRDLERELEPE